MTTLWFRAALLPDGWAEGVRLTIEAGRIASVQAGAAAEPGDERHGTGLPGLVNVHSHAFQRAMAGLAERRGPTDDDFWSWRMQMYRLVDGLGPEQVEAVAALAYAEMLEAGFIRVTEFHYLHNDPAGRPYADPAEMAVRIAAAADETGIGLTLLPVFYAHSGFGGAPPTAGQRRFINDLDGFAALVEASRAAISGLEDAGLGVAPHSLRAVTPEELAEVVALAPDGPVHIHAAEQQKEVADCLAWSGRRPAAWLLDHAGVDRRWCLIHATHVDAAEVAALAERGAVAGLCPVTEGNLGDGIFPARDFLARGGRFGIGTDSNVLISVADELRLLEYGQRLTHQERNVLAPGPGASTGAALYAQALAGGLQAAGRPDEGLREGDPASFITLAEDEALPPDPHPDGAIDRWLFASARPVVDCVWRRGRKLVAGGRHVRRAEIAARCRRAMTALAGV